MNLTGKERAAMVEDLKSKAAEYRALSLIRYSWENPLRMPPEYFTSMALNYEALAEALAERKPFEAVA